MSAQLDIVIAVHDSTRPLGRAIRSVLDRNVDGAVRVIVVCHGLAVSAFSSLVTEFEGTNIRWEEFTDGIPSPAGPFNHGLRLADAPFVGVMGSDDFFDAGAVQALLGRLRGGESDVIVYPMRHQDETSMANPLSRPGRHHALDPIKDRLAYRTAPLAVIRRAVIETLGLRFTESVRTGEDVNFSARLWFSGAVVDFYPADPCYVIGSDALSRVTTTPMDIDVELAAFFDLFERLWLGELSGAARASLATKTLRIHVLGNLRRRHLASRLGPEEIAAFGRLTRLILSVSPRALAPFALRERAILDELSSRQPGATTVTALLERHAKARRYRRLVPSNPFWVLSREGEIRKFLRYRSWPR